MAKYNPNKAKQAKAPVYPSQYGSHTSMLDAEATEALGIDHLVALKDDEGIYVTDRDALNTLLADPNRYMNRPKTVSDWDAVQKKFEEVRVLRDKPEKSLV